MKGLGPCGGARPRRSCLQAGSHAIALPSSCRCYILMKECRGWDTEELGASAASVCTWAALRLQQRQSAWSHLTAWPLSCSLLALRCSVHLAQCSL